MTDRNCTTIGWRIGLSSLNNTWFWRFLSSMRNNSIASMDGNFLIVCGAWNSSLKRAYIETSFLSLHPCIHYGTHDNYQHSVGISFHFMMHGEHIRQTLEHVEIFVSMLRFVHAYEFILSLHVVFHGWLPSTTHGSCWCWWGGAAEKLDTHWETLQACSYEAWDADTLHFKVASSSEYPGVALSSLFFLICVTKLYDSYMSNYIYLAVSTGKRLNKLKAESSPRWWDLACCWRFWIRYWLVCEACCAWWDLLNLGGVHVNR